MEKKGVSILSLCLSPMSKKQATVRGKNTNVNIPTNNYTPALNLSDTDIVRVNTCPQLTPQKHDNQIIRGKGNSAVLFI